MDLDVRRLSSDASPRLVQQHARVRQREALALGTGAEQHGGGRGRLTEAERRNGRLDVLHRVVDREQSGDVTAR